MTERTQVEKAKTRRTEETVEETKTPTKAEQTEKLKAETDALLDEIDSILTEESVAWLDFQQKGGE